MDESELTIEIATRDDVPGIFDLQERNLPESGGMLSVQWSPDWFEKAIDTMPIIVARSGGRVVGYLVCTSLSAQTHIPIVKQMLAAYPGSGDAYIYGPICVAEEQRGRGVAALMFQQLRTQLPGREGITFIRWDNAVSRTVAERIGIRSVGKFEHAGVEYVVMAYR
jgi:ribosomal protein S18 acetylase RimI-like enzyme